MLFIYGSGRQQNRRDKNAGNFADAAVRCGAHRPMEHIRASLEANMDAAIGRVIASHRRGGRHGRRFRIKHAKH